MQQPYPTTYFSSIDELCSQIHDATKGWDSRWYRGTKTPGYPLLPKLFRDADLAKREGYISVEFRRRSKPHLSQITDPFGWLCGMQHFSIPTRLLDWTESLAVALYFTVRPFGLDVVAPTIWVLDPFELYALTDPKRQIIPISDTDCVLGNCDLSFDDFDGRYAATAAPIPVAPDFIFPRIAVQNGAFTLHGTDRRPMEEIFPTDKRKFLRKFVARSENVETIWNSIDLLIPSSDAIFPDIEGVKEYVV